MVGGFVAVEVPTVKVDVIVAIEAVFATELDGKWCGALEFCGVCGERRDGLQDGARCATEGADGDNAFDAAFDAGFVGEG